MLALKKNNMPAAEIAGMIFNIQRFSIHDGPGIRTTVFFKGCPLHCYWCHNPEGLNIIPQLQYWQHRCNSCHACAAVCKTQAHVWIQDHHFIDRGKCTTCFDCTLECYNGALEICGKKMEITEIMQQILPDQPFYATSGGGVTLSGGEPLMQPRFCLELLKACKHAGLHTCVETCAEAEWHHLSAILPYADLLLVDLKVLDESLHEKATGSSNKRILHNIHQLAKSDNELTFRIPLVPGLNDSVEMISTMARYLWSLREPKVKIDVLPFHQLATAKYDSLNVKYKADRLPAISGEHLDELLACVADSGHTSTNRNRKDI